MKKDLSLNDLYQIAIILLARRDHSIQELRRKLQQRVKDKKLNIIDQVILLLKEKSYLNDERFMYNYARMRANRGYGHLRIAAELKERGVSAEITGLLRKGNIIQTDIKKTYLKKFGSLEIKPENSLEKAKQIRYLQYKGFSPTEINELFKNYLKKAHN